MAEGRNIRFHTFFLSTALLLLLACQLSESRSVTEASARNALRTNSPFGNNPVVAANHLQREKRGGNGPAYAEGAAGVLVGGNLNGGHLQRNKRRGGGGKGSGFGGAIAEGAGGILGGTLFNGLFGNGGR